ncbi:MAG TPA: hypothetical protein VFB06_11495 [Streptosporangiaceae bacterium]|nr:hypothetical protein [Streptosporangiaceae bacterium]
MTAPVRIPGKLGRLHARFPAGLRELGSYAAGRLPAPPPSVPVPQIADWDCLGNDTYGDCGVAGLAHGFESAAADAGEQETFPGADQVVSYYLAYTGGQDSGVVLSDFLAYVRQHGFYGHAVTAFAPVAVHDIPSLQFATWAYDFAYTGIDVTQAMMDAFSAGQPWTAAMAHGDPLGGHCIPVVAYDGTYLYVVTWGKVQAVEYPAWHAMSSEAWAVITGEVAGGDGHGISLAALQADLDRLGVPAPPASAGQPGLLADVASLVREVAADASRDISDVISFLHAHGL